ncbi:hypothetical protein ACOTI9_14955 [Achromobacter mucicolens]|uniref:hypothetical protein n=1 Tax=Achromobacter mucicolens TaxID=1389922 RepID=UPI003B9D8B40
MRMRYRVALGVLLLGFCLVLVKNWPSNSNEWASWVQAIGSIAAIVAAVVISQTQQRESRQIEAGKFVDRVRTALYLVEHCQSLVLELKKARGTVAISPFDQVERALLGFSLNGLPGELVLKMLAATQLATSSRQLAERYDEQYETYGGGSPDTEDWLESLLTRLDKSVAGLRQSLEIAQATP